MICPYCGETIADDSKFCSHCGKPLFSVEMDDYDLYAADTADPEVDRRLIAGADEDTHILPAGEVSAEAPSSGKDGDMQAGSGSGGTAAPYGKLERDKVPVSVDGDTHPLPAEEAARAVDPDLDLTPYDLDEDGEQPERRTESASRNERDGRAGESRARLERYVPKRNARAEEPEAVEEEDGGGGGHTAFLVVLCAALAAAVFFALYYMVSSGIFSGRTAVRTGSTEVKPITVIANQTTPTPAASDAGGGTDAGQTAAPTSAPAADQPAAAPSVTRHPTAAPDATAAPTPEQTQIPEATEAVTPAPTEDPDAVVLTPDEDNEATDNGQEEEQDQNNQEDVVG